MQITLELSDEDAQTLERYKGQDTAEDFAGRCLARYLHDLRQELKDTEDEEPPPKRKDRRGRPRMVDEETRQFMRELRKQGRTIRDIEAWTGCSRGQVATITKEPETAGRWYKTGEDGRRHYMEVPKDWKEWPGLHFERARDERGGSDNPFSLQAGQEPTEAPYNMKVITRKVYERQFSYWREWFEDMGGIYSEDRGEYWTKARDNVEKYYSLLQEL